MRVVSISEKLVLLTAKWIASCFVCLYRLLAPADKEASVLENTEHPLGILPHQVRGFVAHFAQLVVMGHAFNKCTACSSIVRTQYFSARVDPWDGKRIQITYSLIQMKFM